MVIIKTESDFALSFNIENVIFFILGSILGFFLLVVISRDESNTRGRFQQDNDVFCFNLC